MLSLSTCALTLLLAAPAADAPDAYRRSELTQAIKAFNDLDDKSVLTLLRDLLARHPTPTEEARARIYLGLMEMNNHQLEAARKQFRQAIAADVAVELPRGASPKAKLLFIQVRDEMMRGHDLGGTPSASAEPRPAPAQVPLVMTAPALAPPPPAFSPFDSGGSTSVEKKGGGGGTVVAGWVMGSIAVAVLGTGVGFGVAQNSSKAGLPGSGSNPVTDANQATSVGQTIARDGLIADVLFGVGGAAAVASLVLFLVPSGGSGEASPTASLSVGAGPGGLDVAGRW